jgi:hypothetical protein
MAKMKAALAGVSYLVIVSLAAYNLRGQLFGTNIPSASASSASTAAATPGPAASSVSSSASSSAASPQNQVQTPAQPATPPATSSGTTSTTTKPALAQKTPAPAHVQQSSAPVAGNGAVTVGERLPDFLFTGLNGNTMTESTLRGHKTLFIIVSPVCPHCQKELKLLHGIVNDYPSIEPVFASVFPLDQTRPLADMTGEGDHIYTGARELAQDLGIKGVPFLMLIDEKGVVRAIRTGEIEEPVFRDILGRFARGEAVPEASNIIPAGLGKPQGAHA